MKKNFSKGTILIITLLIVFLLLVLGSYFLGFLVTELRIVKSHKTALKAYYLAEAGIYEAIWKLKNDTSISDGDSAWANDFIDPTKNPDANGNYWSASFQRENFIEAGSYFVTIKNSSIARGEITSLAVINLENNRTVQRVVKVAVFKPAGSQTNNSPFFSGGPSENISLLGSRLRIYHGNIFSNNNLSINLSEVRVYDNSETGELEGQILAVNNFNKLLSTIVSEAICAKNICTNKCLNYLPGRNNCPPENVAMPIIDFDTPQNPNSLKNRAQNLENLGRCQILCNNLPCSNKCVLSSSEFENLLWQVGQGGTLKLNSEITYVTGQIDIKGGKNLVVNGILAADGTVDIGTSYKWTKGGQKQEGLSQITIDDLNILPAGLLTKGKINFGPYSSFRPVNILGLIYANQEISLISVPEEFNLTGGMMGRKLDLTSFWSWLNITLDNERINRVLNLTVPPGGIPPIQYSPIIVIDHWEETY